MKFRQTLTASVALLPVALLSTPAFAQSTGSVDFDDEIVVTGSASRDIGGVTIPETAKAKQVLGEEVIRRQRPGQTVNDIVNLVPGVSFQNNDPWGSNGGGFTIRGFGADRVSQTLDGLPLNDSGNYALYSNQQVDSEVIEQVNVNLGSTDVDSPTASATGGTINIRTREPSDTAGLMTTMTFGDVLAKGAENTVYMRGFGMIDTGDFTGIGTKAFASLSYTNYGVPYNPYGEVKKTQFNGRIWQDLGSDGDFIAISGHFNRNRNNFAGSESLEDLLGYYDGTFTKKERFTQYEESGVYPCTIPAGQTLNGGGTAGVSERYDDRNGCGAAFYRRYNPSDTGNIRGASRFTLTDKLVLTVDPSYQYVKANGGGPDDLRESFFTPGGATTGLTGAFNGGYYFGRDLNGDGDLEDRIAGIDPSQTHTDRYGVVANLIYDISDDHRVRVAYTWDRARHRQTGQLTDMLTTGEPSDVFAIDNALLDVNGNEVNKRDRLSYAILHQVSGEYRGEFGDLTAIVGLRAPFFSRELNQNCYTTSISGFVDCPAAGQDLSEYEAANPDYASPQSRTYKYDKLLPNVGFTYDFSPAFSTFANYAKGLSVPGTDPLYDSLYLADDDRVRPVPETTDSFDLGVRYSIGPIQAQLSGWYTRYQNRLASAFDPTANDGEGAFVFRNLGRVDKYGLDGSIAYRPTRNSLIYIFGSLNKSEIKENVQNGVDDDGNPVFLGTAGNMESGTPKYSFGARGQIAFGDVELGAQVKRTGSRWINDLNEDRAPAYTLVDLDARWTIGEFATGGDVALQLNLTNLFDQYYIGYFGGSLDDFPFAQIGAPRAASLSVIIGY
ncbi:iron complex outermembrane receptor protein [Sphingopyxis italica]|uniref:Iron complex outermembrane receptor protein n=1 Tax=Sphingopyxis italica TaxID=1129133 RepID=A0A7X6B8C1_9SPHN|nr:TonB-dependent receptor [Sphingopyxis italica]NJB88801.1 iron complex outermembrane receptor protein [Sphingopyxis italica]